MVFMSPGSPLWLTFLWEVFPLVFSGGAVQGKFGCGLACAGGGTFPSVVFLPQASSFRTAERLWTFSGAWLRDELRKSR